jgi:hypothetical protein
MQLVYGDNNPKSTVDKANQKCRGINYFCLYFTEYAPYKEECFKCHVSFCVSKKILFHFIFLV